VAGWSTYLQSQLCQAVGLGLTSCRALRLDYHDTPYQQLWDEVRFGDAGSSGRVSFCCFGASNPDGKDFILS
jgi:hypothetical protein